MEKEENAIGRKTINTGGQTLLFPFRERERENCVKG